MTLPHLALLGAGAVTAIGDDVASTCAAMRARFNNHKETDFTDQDWHPIVASRAAVDPALVGEGRLAEMAVRAIRQLAPTMTPDQLSDIPWLFCTPEESRAGRPVDDKTLLGRIARQVGLAGLPPDSAEVPHGRTAGLLAMTVAQKLLSEGKHRHVLLLAVDSLVDADALAELDEAELLLTPENSNGLIPGEAAVALLLGVAEAAGGGSADRPKAPAHKRLAIVFDSAAFTKTDPAAVPAQSRPDAPNRKPVPIDGLELATAIQLACEQSNCPPDDITVRLADCNGLDSGFKESSLAESRVFQSSEQPLPVLWLPAESAGEIGAAFVPLSLAWVWHAAVKGYLPGLPDARALIHATNSDGLRGAAIFHYREL